MARYYGAALAALAVVGAQDVSRECKMKCNEALGNLPQALDCRDWRMMLPRPKVGKACTQAYDDAAFAVCTARCEGREPPRKEALTGNFCREYTAKTPKPTMGKSCRSGYAKGFDKGLADAMEFTDYAMSRLGRRLRPVFTATCPGLNAEIKRLPHPLLRSIGEPVLPFHTRGTDLQRLADRFLHLRFEKRASRRIPVPRLPVEPRDTYNGWRPGHRANRSP